MVVEVRVPVEFLTDVQAAAYAAFDGAPSRTELERFFFLDDVGNIMMGVAIFLQIVGYLIMKNITTIEV